MKWDNLTVADLLDNRPNPLQELTTETRQNAGATASFDYVNDKNDQKLAETMKWVTTVGELATSKLSWSVWDWNDPNAKDKRPDVCIGSSAEVALVLKQIRDGGTEMSETITLDNRSFGDRDKKKAAGKVTIVLNAQVVKASTGKPNQLNKGNRLKKGNDRTVSAGDQVEVSVSRIDTNELPRMKPGILGPNNNDVYVKVTLGPSGKERTPASRLVLSVWDHNNTRTHTKIGSVEVFVAGMLRDIRAGNNIYPIYLIDPTFSQHPLSYATVTHFKSTPFNTPFDVPHSQPPSPSKHPLSILPLQHTPNLPPLTPPHPPPSPTPSNTPFPHPLPTPPPPPPPPPLPPPPSPTPSTHPF